MEICKSHKECFEKVCSLCEDYEPLSSHAVLCEGWRDVRIELPKKEGFYLTYNCNIDVNTKLEYKWQSVCRYNAKGFMNRQYDIEPYVTHWRELPAPPAFV